jgi:hypothetical protein
VSAGRTVAGDGVQRPTGERRRRLQIRETELVELRHPYRQRGALARVLGASHRRRKQLDLQGHIAAARGNALHRLQCHRIRGTDRQHPAQPAPGAVVIADLLLGNVRRLRQRTAA